MIDRPWVIVIGGGVVEGPYLAADEAIAEAQATKRGGTLAETSTVLPWPSLANLPHEEPVERYILVGGEIQVEALQ